VNHAAKSTTSVLVLTLTVNALADDLRPPEWRGDARTTFQAWDFSAPAPGPWAPETYANEYYTPGGANWWELLEANAVSPLWVASYSDRTGLLTVQDTASSRPWFRMPNAPGGGVRKTIRLQITYYPPASVMTYEYRGSDGSVYTGPGTLVERIAGPWFTDIVELAVGPNPDGEEITIVLADGPPAYIDQVVIDTLCGFPPIYVDDDAPQGGDGTSWATAYAHLQDALSEATSGREIRVAQGTYRPDESDAVPGGTGNRSTSFQLITGVTINGGYRGCPGGDCTGDPSERNVDTYETVLSGDLAENDGPDFANNDENSYSIVTGIGVGASAVLDGITIIGGNANETSGESARRFGGGVYIEGGGPTVRDWSFR